MSILGAILVTAYLGGWQSIASIARQMASHLLVGVDIGALIWVGFYFRREIVLPVANFSQLNDAFRHYKSGAAFPETLPGDLMS